MVQLTRAAKGMSHDTLDVRYIAIGRLHIHFAPRR